MPLFLVPLLAILAFLLATWAYPPLLRFFFWPLVLGLYRFRVHGRDRVPQTGPALIVCNHVSYIDWIVLGLACPRRLTFILWSGYYRKPIPRFFLSWARYNTIRIDNRTARPHAVAESLKAAAEALDAGQVVVVFPEGRLTRTGNMRPFGRGVEYILKQARTPVPVIPTCTEGLWGSIFSHQGGKILWKWPRGFRLRVAVMFGRPLNQRAVGSGQQAVKAAEMFEKPLNPGAWPLNPTPGPSPKRGGGANGEANGINENEFAGSSVPTAPELHLAVQETKADFAVAESDRVLLVHRAFARRAMTWKYAFKTCVIDQSTGTERILTWSQLFVGSACLAGVLRPRLQDVQNVGLWLPTSLGGALANLALTYLGKTSVNLNYTAGADALRSAVAQASVRTIVSSRKFVGRVPLDLPDEIERLYLEDLMPAITTGQKVRTMVLGLLLPAWALERFVLGLHRQRVDDVLTIIFSSGSTGEPKGVVLTHRNIGSNAEGMARTVDIQAKDRVLAVLPFFHSFGYTVCLWMPLVCGASVVYFPDPRQAKEVSDLCRRHKATVMLSTATFLRFHLRRSGEHDFQSLRLLVCGAEKLPVKLQDEFEARFGVRPLEGYGCTELSPVVSANLPDVTVGRLKQTCNVIGTVGQPIHGVCIRAFDPDSLVPLPPGVEGVLCGRGPNVMAGYLGRPDLTKRVVFDGWYNTGDRGLIEEAGFIRITGRVSRFAKIAGEMVPLERIEEELHEAIGTQGDRTLAVAAVPDEKRGERVVVLYLAELEGKIAGLLDCLGKRGLPNLWVPDVRDCYRVEAFPLLGSGKLDLKRLSELAKQKANVEGLP